MPAALDPELELDPEDTCEEMKSSPVPSGEKCAASGPRTQDRACSNRHQGDAGGGFVWYARSSVSFGAFPKLHGLLSTGVSRDTACISVAKERTDISRSSLGTVGAVERFLWRPSERWKNSNLSVEGFKSFVVVVVRQQTARL